MRFVFQVVRLVFNSRVKVSAITATLSGVGLATAMLAAERGKAHSYCRSAKILKHLAARIANAGGQAIDVVADVADREKCASRPAA